MEPASFQGAQPALHLYLHLYLHPYLQCAMWMLLAITCTSIHCGPDLQVSPTLKEKLIYCYVNPLKPMLPVIRESKM